MADQESPVDLSIVSPLEAALRYAARGWPVVPLHAPDGNGCSCSKGAACDGVGKHPRIGRWVEEASTDEGVIREWWSRWPDANVGIATGAISSLVVLDVDTGGDAELVALQAKYGPLPATVEAITGSGGRHLYFALRSGTQIKNSVRSVGAGLDVRGDGGLIVAEPSLHVAGERYRWSPGRSPSEVELAELPAWLIALASSSSAPRVASSPTTIGMIGEGARNDTLYRIGCSLLSKGLAPASILGALIAENQAKCEPPLSEVEVQQIAASVEVRRDAASTGRPRPQPMNASQQPVGAVIQVLDPTIQKQELLNIYSSICRLLRAESQALFGGQLAWDEMLLSPTLVRQGKPPMELSPGDRSRIHERMEVLYPPGGVTPAYARSLIDLALEQVAQENSYHPVRDYLANLRWDGVKRIEQLKTTVLNSDDPPIADVVLRRWMISAVARAMTPGCKVDTVLILVGPQGAGKSSFFEALASEPWFSDSTIDIHNKDAYMALARAWIVEFPELESMQRARDVDSVKAFLSSRVDSYRPPYGRSVMKVPRSCIIVGTTNQDTFLTDPTGNRRYWPVNAGASIDLSKLRAERDQLWAEALVAFRAGEQWWLSDVEEQQLAELRSQFDVIDPWDEQIDKFLRQTARQARRMLQGKPSPFSSADALEGIGKPKGQWTRADEMRVATILKRKGYTQSRDTDSSGKRRRVWKHPKWEEPETAATTSAPDDTRPSQPGQPQ